VWWKDVNMFHTYCKQLPWGSNALWLAHHSIVRTKFLIAFQSTIYNTLCQAEINKQNKPVRHWNLPSSPRWYRVLCRQVRHDWSTALDHLASGSLQTLHAAQVHPKWNKDTVLRELFIIFQYSISSLWYMIRLGVEMRFLHWRWWETITLV